MEREKENLSLSELLGEFTRELRKMISEEVELAKSEMSKKISDTKKDGIYIGIGAMLLWTSLSALTAALIIVLSYGLPLWLSALVVTMVVAGVGYLFLQKGLADIKHRRLTPDQTIETLKEGGEWVKNRIT